MQALFAALASGPHAARAAAIFGAATRHRRRSYRHPSLRDLFALSSSSGSETTALAIWHTVPRNLFRNTRFPILGSTDALDDATGLAARQDRRRVDRSRQLGSADVGGGGGDLEVNQGRFDCGGAGTPPSRRHPPVRRARASPSSHPRSRRSSIRPPRRSSAGYCRRCVSACNRATTSGVRLPSAAWLTRA